MSQYIKKPHGLIIGRGDIFFYRDADGDFREFPALVRVLSLTFDRFTTLHAGIRSVVEQLIFDTALITDESIVGGLNLLVKCRLRPYWIGWLDENCPGWGYPPPENADRVPPIYFSMYRHAKAFTQHVAYLLEGERYLDRS